MLSHHWDFLILTAANEPQAAIYRQQLGVRAGLGLLGEFRRWLVVTDPGGKRVGSGGSTLCCLLEVLNETGVSGPPGQWQKALENQRILIVHAGGDSRRLPAYGPCGKIFVPLPCESDNALTTTLFDYQLPIYAALPPSAADRGQIVITSGDVLLGFDPHQVIWGECGITGLGCRAAPERAARHGVYCPQNGGTIRRFLQKPSIEVQRQEGAIDQYGETVLDIGVIAFDAATAVQLLKMCDVRETAERHLAMHGPMLDGVVNLGLDFYREICCVLGTETTFEHYQQAVAQSGSRWPQELLRQIYDAVSPLASSVCVLKTCDFLHFGSTREILASGRRILQQHQQRLGQPGACLNINNQFAAGIAVPTAEAWIEGCRVHEPLDVQNQSVLVGVDVDQPLALRSHTCLDILPGSSRSGDVVHFVRCYHDSDPLHNTPADQVQLCGEPLSWWLDRAAITPEAIWQAIPSADRSVWNARLYPAVSEHHEYRQWLWMLSPAEANQEQFRGWADADRYSFEEMARLADVQQFHARREAARANDIRHNLRRLFRSDSGFSAADLTYLIRQSDDRCQWLISVLSEAHCHWQQTASEPQQAFTFSRVIHTIGQAVEAVAYRSDRLPALEETLELLTAPAGSEIPQPNIRSSAGEDWNEDDKRLATLFPGLLSRVPDADQSWLEAHGLGISPDMTVAQWAQRAKDLAFEHMRRQILSATDDAKPPRNCLRSDEIVWGRAPARLDLGGGWTDTPPYSLEHGGCVLNAAVELNGQPPIQAFARVVTEPVVRIRSIDVGTQVELSSWDQLLDNRVAHGEFSLVQAALAISGFVPRNGQPLADLLTQFGGGLELTTLAAIPKGSGLGTSSIMGAVILAVVNRVLGRALSSTELFHGVLRLEQKLTTGGGWQDQIGGSLGGLKLISTQPGLIPEATVRYVPADVLDPRQNGGQTLLYYTGITRLAKNILQQVVGRYLSRDREAMRVLRDLHSIAGQVSESLARKDLAEFGRLIDRVWALNKRLDPDSSNRQIEDMLARVRPHIHGAKLLGAGGGGFLLLICKSRDDAELLRSELESNPPNQRARFFHFAVSSPGLEVSVC